ncbi:MAG: 3-hydroxybutyryl-CoA dehydrogenase [Deltaproteobacteria bacterium]|nr:3-hydroxybutyryl-CoA dehydrogenase [Deltaproteobacteria bacterium]MBW1929045.1 3-hydroxybutyryl-CoA dehydrogenase [Deltaproteobacteria bacterium]MBW2024578.1 3-hydroxybutyryl-CoA dehydrogenase [Deltaproteobacteria bacterium]MBW2125377.1 3-hydroxybutyryl-CoA dehydrogenase [Deltaproteobacteria bacterium]
MEIKTLGVVGAGQMGSGIAQVGAACGLTVIMNDVQDAFVEKGFATIEKSLGRMAKKGKLTEQEVKEILGRIEGSTSLQDMAKADFVVEAIVENEEVKLNVFKQLDDYCKEGVILSSNTSSISITKIASATKRPENVIGMHFMNPVPVMKLVEIIKGLATSEETYQVTRTLAEKMGKVPVPANDFPGFISNRILMPMINEAVYALFEGVGSAEDIDKVMKLGMNHPMGPLALADLIGLDTCLAIMEVLHKGLGDDKYRPCPLLRKYVDAGWLGQKSGRGFYTYE